MTQSFKDLIADDVMQSLDLDGAIVMLWSLEGDRILAASQPAVRLFGGFKSEDLTGRRFGPALPSTARLAELSRHLSVDEPARVERLRFFLGSRSDVLTCLCQRVRLKSNGEALLVISKDQRHVHGRRPSLVSVLSQPEEETRPAVADASAATANPIDMPRKPVRFVFQTEPDGRIESVSTQLRLAVGEAHADIVGRRVTDLGATPGVEGAEVIARKIEAGEGWQGVEVRWPMAGATTLVPVELSGLPIRDAGRKLVGFRGFGLIRLDLAPLSRSAAAEPTVEPSPSPAAPLTLVTSEASNIVPLNANVAKPVLEIVAPPKPEKTADDRLSQSERNAFREIAKALGARLADDMPSPPGHQHTIETKEAEASVPATEPLPALPAPPENLLLPPPVEQSASVGVEPAELESTAERFVEEVSLDTGETAAAKTPDLFEIAPMSVCPSSGEPAETMGEPVELTPEPAKTEEPSHVEDGDGFALIDRLPIGVVIVQDGRPAYMNHTLLGLLGLDQMSGDADLTALFSAPLDRLADEPAEITLRTADGNTMAVSALGEHIVWQSRPALLVSMRRAVAPPPVARLVSDESEGLALRQDLKTVETERDEFKAILDTATDGVISLDAEGRIIGLNRSAEALFGFDQNEVAGQRFSALFAGESHASALDYLQGLKSGGVASVLNDGREVVGREKKGGRIPLFMTLGRISDRDGGRFCAVLRDLTAWKKAEAELTESKRVAERASAMKSDFLAKISHEIRTPMNAIIGFSEVMRTEQFGPIGSERYREYLGDIHRSGEHVISLVNDLLDLSKIEAGRADLSFTSVSINDIVQDCISMMQPQAARERVILRSNLADTLPAVVADERSIKQVVLNLLSNACKFNQPGGQVIISTALSDEGEAVIRVRDTGIGMSEKDIEGAMQPFRQMSPTRRGGGTGLGLPLTKALVEANRASLAIRSAPNEGTLAEVTFPATRVLAE